jgi:hypothetical protein
VTITSIGFWGITQYVSEATGRFVGYIKAKSDWGTLVPRTNVENIMKLGFVLE